MSQATKALLTRVRPEIEFKVRMAAAQEGKTKSEYLSQLLESHFQKNSDKNQENQHVS